MLQTTERLPIPERSITISSRGTRLTGLLAIPTAAEHLVIFAHATPNGCHHLQNHYLARKLYQKGLATLLVDLLSREEQLACQRSPMHYDQMTLAMRLIGVTDWMNDQPDMQDFLISYLGLSEGGTVASLAAMERPKVVQSVILPSSQRKSIQLTVPQLQVPVLFISGESDIHNILLRQRLFPVLPKHSHFVVVDRAAELMDADSLDKVSHLIEDWLDQIKNLNSPVTRVNQPVPNNAKATLPN
jgi:putative phosphoribosyl transferase